MLGLDLGPNAASTRVSSPKHDLAWQLPASTAPPGNQAMTVETPTFCGQWESTKENKYFIHLDLDRDENITHIVIDMNKDKY
jgi:hypothetical protein